MSQAALFDAKKPGSQKQRWQARADFEAELIRLARAKGARVERKFVLMIRGERTVIVEPVYEDILVVQASGTLITESSPTEKARYVMRTFVNREVENEERDA